MQCLTQVFPESLPVSTENDVFVLGLEGTPEHSLHRVTLNAEIQQIEGVKDELRYHYILNSNVYAAPLTCSLSGIECSDKA